MKESLGVLDLLQRARELSGKYENGVLAQINDHVIRMGMMTEPYFWHVHPDSDETFLGLEGTVILQLENQRIELSAGQLFTVPKGVKHRTAPARSIRQSHYRARGHDHCEGGRPEFSMTVDHLPKPANFEGGEVKRMRVSLSLQG